MLAQAVAHEVTFPHLQSHWVRVLHIDSQRCRPQVNSFNVEASPSTYCVAKVMSSQTQKVSAGSCLVYFRLSSLLEDTECTKCKSALGCSYPVQDALPLTGDSSAICRTLTSPEESDTTWALFSNPYFNSLEQVRQNTETFSMVR